ncbi:SIR2 family protein [Pedobacter sp. FW305-3-2-15-E-R2A2]|uniref:SIR2 family protein n=1 Tax=Pedobacter sp. FW305-3-2-15-E-R2A2 TaxID=3140251 RepID=UPI0031405C78
MLIDEILSKFIDSGPRSYYSFETFILNLLKIHIEGLGKKFTISNNIRIPGDAIADEGFDDFKGRTLIDVKLNLDRISPKIFIEQFQNRLNRWEILPEIKNILIINGRPISGKSKTIILNELQVLAGDLQITLWEPEDINRIVSKHRKEANKIASNLFSLRLESAVKKDNRNWKEERDEKIEQLKEFYERGQFSMFLGAGVSSSAGMPDWNTLLNSLFVSYLSNEFTDSESISDDDIKQIVSRLNEVDEPSALMAARYLRKGLSKERTEVKIFTDTITDNLYKLRNKSKNISSDLIQSISNLCMPRRTGAKVRSVVTYNFDDLIERELDRKSISHHSIYTDNELSDPDELPIYHVHGFLPEDKSKYDLLDKTTLVFSEEGYHQIYSDSYHWSNLVQLYNFREYNCLMIGLSMTDPNLRRLLDISARNIESSRHFTFLKRISIDDFCYFTDKKSKEKKQIVQNIKGAEQFLNRHHKLNEELMKELGVSILWYTNYDEIPDILNKINVK